MQQLPTQTVDPVDDLLAQIDKAIGPSPVAQTPDVDALIGQIDAALASAPGPSMDEIAAQKKRPSYGQMADALQAPAAPTIVGDTVAAPTQNVASPPPPPAVAAAAPALPETAGMLRSRTGQLYRPTPMGTMPILDAPHVGAQQIAHGAKELFSAATDTTPVPPSNAPLMRSRTGALYQPPPEIDPRTKAGAADILEGGMKVATPLVVAEGLAAPVSVLSTLAKATAATKATEAILTKAGAKPEDARLASDVVGAVAAGVPLKNTAANLLDVAAAKTADTARAAILATKLRTPDVARALQASAHAGTHAPIQAMEQIGGLEQPPPVGETLGDVIRTRLAPEPPELNLNQGRDRSKPLAQQGEQAATPMPGPQQAQEPPTQAPPAAVRPGASEAVGPVAPSREPSPAAPAVTPTPVDEVIHQIDTAIGPPTDTAGRPVLAPGGYVGPERRSVERVSTPDEDRLYADYREKLARGETTVSPAAKRLLEQKQALDDAREQAAIAEIRQAEPKEVPHAVQEQGAVAGGVQRGARTGNESPSGPVGEGNAGRVSQPADVREEEWTHPGHAAEEIAPASPVVFRSGNQRAPADLQGYIQAGQPIGITHDAIYQVRARAAQYAREGGQVFVDSGAFGGTPNFDEVLKHYNEFLDHVDEHNPGRQHPALFKNVYLVAPDKVGDAETTSRLQEHYQQDIHDLIGRGANVVVPVQVGKSLVYDAGVVARTWPDAIIGIPGNKAAMSLDTLKDVVAKMSVGRAPRGFHFLGMGEKNPRFQSYVDAIHERFPRAEITADSNRTQAMMVPGRPAHEMATRLTDERSDNAIDDKPAGDTTELTGQFYRGEFDAFTPRELGTIAEALGVAPQDIRKAATGARPYDSLADFVDSRGGDQVIDLALQQIAKARMVKAERPGARTDAIAEHDKKPTIPVTPKSEPASHQPATSGAQVTHNTEKGSIEVRFPKKPAPEVLDKLKGAGFRWAKSHRAWYRKLKASANDRGYIAEHDRLMARARTIVGGGAPAEEAPRVNVPEGYQLQDVSEVTDAEEARIKGGRYTVVAQRISPFKSERGYGDTPAAARADALRRVGASEPQPAKPQIPVTPKEDESSYDAAARGKAYEDMTDAELRELLEIGVGDEPQKAAIELNRRKEAATKPADRIATKLYAVFAHNLDAIPKDPRELRKLAARITGKSEQEIADHIDELNDAVEAALAAAVPPSVPSTGLSLTDAVTEAQELEARLPRAHRSLEKTKLQQFSTPLPISVIAAHAAQVTPEDRVLEPTAGTGNLIAAIRKPENGGPQIFANELSDRRADLLRAQGYLVKQADYLKTTFEPPTVIVTNPPWGKYSTGKYGRGVASGFAPSDVAERFVAKNMADLADGGRLVAVMPTTMLNATSFKKWLASNYAVRGIIKSPAGSYDTRATSVESVLLVVDKVKPTARYEVYAKPPEATLIGTFDTLDEAAKFVGESGTAHNIKSTAGTLPKVIDAADWPAYISAVEAIHDRSPIGAGARRPAEAPRPAPERGPERVSGSPRSGGAKPGRHAPVEPGRPADMVAGESGSGGRGAVEPERAPEGAAAPPDGAPPAKVSGPTADTRRDAAASRFFAPYVRRTALRGQPHPKLLVEAKQLAGVPYPALTAKSTPSMQKAIDAGRVSVEQAEQALAVLQANSGEKPHGYLAADAVGVGKSREIAMTLLGAMDRAKAEKRPLRLMLTAKSRDNVEDLLEEIHFVASGKPSTQGGTVPFSVYRLADDYPGAKKTGNAYEPLPKGEHAIYVVDSYNAAPYRQALVDADLHGIVGDEVQRFMNQDAAIGGAWTNLHARIFKTVARPEQFFAYFTATPAQKVEDYRYLYGLRLWPIDGFSEWLNLVTGGLDEKKAKELEEATERGSVKSLDDVVKSTDVDVVGGDADESGEPKKKRPKSWDSYASNVFAQRLTPAEGEQIPREWKMLGRFSARDLWRAGTTFEIHEFKLSPAQRKHYDQFVDLALDIYRTAYKYGLYDKSGKSSRFGVTGMLQFAAKRVQMQPALEEAVRLAKKLAGEGYQPVLSIINVTEMSAERGHLVAAIEKINTRMVDDDPDDPEGGLTDMGEIPEAVIDRARLMDRVRDLGSLADPVDYIADELGRDKVAFIIGKEKSSRRKASAEFQSGQRTYAVISGAGSTGINLDQRLKTPLGPGHGRRVFLDVQYEWSAMEGVQRYGRVDRASSIAPPRLIALTSGNAAEKKFLATIANRMAALGALSKGGAEATGAAGNALEEFEILGDDALEAARRAYEESDDDTKRSFATIKSAFRDPNRNGKSPDREDFDPFKPRRDAHGVGMLDFQLPLLLMPVDQANAFWEKFIRYRDELRAKSGEKEAMRSARFSGEVLEKHQLKDHLTLYGVKNEEGKKSGILVGLITPEMPKLRELLRNAKDESEPNSYGYVPTADVTMRRRYVTFSSGDDIITGLQVPWTRISHIANAYGQAVKGPKLDTPERVLEYLKSGETITLGIINPDSGKAWMLRYRPSDGRIAIDNARMVDRTQLLNHGADYVPVGNYWRVANLGKFLERWPVPESAPSSKVSSRGGGSRSFTAQSTILPGAKEFVEQDVVPAATAIAQGVVESGRDIQGLLAPDMVSASSRLAANTTRAALAARDQRIQRARKVLHQATAHYAQLAEDAAADKGDARDRFLRLTDAMEGQASLDTLPAEERAFAKLFKEVLRDRRVRVQHLGKLRNYIENYFPHEWERPSETPTWLQKVLGKRNLAGPKEFLKQRSIPTVREGVDAGLAPVSWNPATLVLNKLVSMEKFITAQELLQDYKRIGLAKFVRVGGKAPQGWVPYAESFGTVWGPPTVPVKEAYDAKLMDGLYSFAKSLGATHVRKVSIGGNRWGYAVSPGDEIVTKVGGPEGVLMHEIGHVLDTRYGLARRWVNNPDTQKELRALADLRGEGQTVTPSRQRYFRKGSEKIANLVHAFIYMPDRARKVAPNAYAALAKLAKETPALKPLLELQKSRSLVVGVNVAEQSVGGAVIKGRYYGPVEGVRLLNNHLSPGLKSSAMYNLYRGVNNFMNQLQLGLSGFHLGMTGAEAIVSKTAQAIVELSRGEVTHAARSAAEAPIATWTTLYKGNRALKLLYEKDANAQLLDGVIGQVIQAGGGIHRDQVMRAYGNRTDAFIDALTKGNVVGAALRAPLAAIEAPTRFIMEWWVPRLKLGAFLDLARTELRTLGPEPDLDEVRRVLGEAWDSIDNRFGQLVYDNLFWSNTLKDVGMGSVRALGWNIGTVREVFAAPISQAARLKAVASGSGGDGARPGVRRVNVGRYPDGLPKYRTVREPWMTHSFAYVIALPIVLGLMGALYTYLHTGERPKDLKDLYWPRTGRKRPDGKDERVFMPSYFKDVYAVAQSPLATVGHKIAPLLNALLEMWRNEDYYGVEIRNSEDPLVEQMRELAEYIGRTAEPFSARAFQQRRESGDLPTSSSIESFFGVSPAPASIYRSKAEERAMSYLPPGVKSREQAEQIQASRDLRAAVRAGGTGAKTSVLDALRGGSLSQRQVQNAVRTSQQSPLRRMFDHLTLEQGLNVYEVADERERAELWPRLLQKANSLAAAAPAERADLVKRLRAAASLPRKTPIPVTAR